MTRVRDEQVDELDADEGGDRSDDAVDGEVAAEQGDGHDQADDVLGGHSFVTPLATRAAGANTAIVVTTKATSTIANSWMRCGSTSDS
ncbi:hypothetical protein [Streptomyces neyagawaensis]|uniref:hypothetical protein n=1 Tax=Streptomyces neyagawaensis TaxID=42238 RepID=UPI0012FF50CB|nr:hypothetical protein [Streptomyces neyagawaensis]MCL6731538.1 hypothetical protein [Streptomyces neyagawaensis]MDE1683094.1 hypothetical protein [Streptomyces neyagawaensis]